MAAVMSLTAAAMGVVKTAVVTLTGGWWEKRWCAAADQLVCMFVVSLSASIGLITKFNSLKFLELRLALVGLLVMFESCVSGIVRMYSPGVAAGCCGWFKRFCRT